MEQARGRANTLVRQSIVDKSCPSHSNSNPFSKLESGVARFESKQNGIQYSELVMKMTTYCAGYENKSFRIFKGKTSIGKMESENSIGIPVDDGLEDKDHATIDVASDGQFYLSTGKGATFVRLCHKSMSSHWPLVIGCRFRVGSTEFLVESWEENGDMRLKGVSGKLRGEEYVIDKTGTSIGRSTENRIHSGDAELSRRHAKIEFDDQSSSYHLSDVGSTNGTFMRLDGPYNKPFRLSIGDQILVSKTCLAVNRYEYGRVANIGGRQTMEDTNAIIQDFQLERLNAHAPQSYFAVYDGHGGASASQYVAKNLHVNLKQDMQKMLNTYEEDCTTEQLDALVHDVLKSCFQRTDDAIIHTDTGKPGSTATTVMILGRRMYIANVGDSRTIMSKAGKAIRLTNDQKPTRPDETQRIKDAGGLVILGRVMGELAISRAFGDSDFKIFPEQIHEVFTRLSIFLTNNDFI